MAAAALLVRALVSEHKRRHHVRMIVNSVETLAKLADDLLDDEIHVWQTSYRREDGRCMLRGVLASYLGVHADDVVFTDGEHGRPGLSPSLRRPLGFNWSHSGNHALIAVGRDVTPGIDVEHRRDRPRSMEIAQRYFTPAEALALEALPPETRPLAFLELWTAKEAVLKAVGRGIAFGLDRLNIVGTADDPALQHLEGEDPGQWQLRRLRAEPELTGALAWRGGPRRIVQHVLAFNP